MPADKTARAYRKIARLKKRLNDYSSAEDYYRKALTEEDTESNAQTQYEIAELL